MTVDSTGWIKQWIVLENENKLILFYTIFKDYSKDSDLETSTNLPKTVLSLLKKTLLRPRISTDEQGNEPQPLEVHHKSLCQSTESFSTMFLLQWLRKSWKTAVQLLFQFAIPIERLQCYPSSWFGAAPYLADPNPTGKIVVIWRNDFSGHNVLHTK